MIRVDKADPPHDFEAQVAIPGRLAIAQLIAAAQATLASTPQPARRTISAKDILAADLPSYWTNALPALCASYNRICAYLGLRITPGVGVAEVDHYKPKSKYQHLAYDWDNYRLSCKLANSFKHKFEDVIDPFEIETGWLGINMLNGHVINRAPDAATHDRLEKTIKRLRLNSEPTFVELRLCYINDYLEVFDGFSISFPILGRDAPFVAREIERQGLKRT